MKWVTTVWSTLLATPTLFFSAAYLMAECMEQDAGCATGDFLPYATVAGAIFLTVAIVQLVFLKLVWRTSEAQGR